MTRSMWSFLDLSLSLLINGEGSCLALSPRHSRQPYHPPGTLLPLTGRRVGKVRSPHLRAWRWPKRLQLTQQLVAFGVELRQRFGHNLPLART